MVTLSAAKEELLEHRKLLVVEIGSAGDDPGRYWTGREDIAEFIRFDFPTIVGERSEKRTFYKTPSPGSWSLFEPDLPAVRGWRHPGGNAFVEHLSPFETVEVQVENLDTLLGKRRPDFLKMNVQGGELAILQGAPLSTSMLLGIHAEANFRPYYVEQPTFSDLDFDIGLRGFQLVDFLSLNHIGFMDAPEESGDYGAGNFRKKSRTIFEAHCLWLPTDIQMMPRFQKIRLALIAEIYGQTEYSTHILANL